MHTTYTEAGVRQNRELPADMVNDMFTALEGVRYRKWSIGVSGYLTTNAAEQAISYYPDTPPDIYTIGEAYNVAAAHTDSHVTAGHYSTYIQNPVWWFSFTGPDMAA